MPDPAPKINEDLLQYLIYSFQVLDYSPDRSKDEWAFSAGQQSVIQKLKVLYRQQRGKKYVPIQK